MQNKDFENILNAGKRNNNGRSLMLLTAGTGSGKSYSVTKFIAHDVAHFGKKRFFFLTNQKINLPVNSFKAAFAEELGYSSVAEMPDDEFYKKVGVVKSLEDTVSDVLQDVNDSKLPKQIVKMKNFNSIIRSLRGKLKVYQSINGLDSRTAFNELKNVEYEFRHLILKCLKAVISSDNITRDVSFESVQDALRKRKSYLFLWVNKRYPTVDLAARRVIILTLDKFARSYVPFEQKQSQYFINSDIIENALIVVDEYDAAKNQLLSMMVQDAWSRQDDLLDLFESIEKAIEKIQENNIPTDLKDIIDDDIHFNQFVNMVQSISQDYHLNLPYRTSLPGFKDNFVLFTPFNVKISRGRGWWSKFNQAQNIVDLIQSNQKVENDLKLYRMLRQVTKVINDFSKIIHRFAKKVLSQKNGESIQTLKPQMTLQSETKTIYNFLNIRGQHQQILMNIGEGWTGQRAAKNRNKLVPESYHAFQKYGLNFYLLSDSSIHELETIVRMIELKQTPENFLLKVLEKADILGLSATCEVPTVLDNFDLDYLREQLGSRYISGYTYLTDTTKAEFNLAERYRKKGVSINVSQANILSVRDGLLPVIESRLSSDRSKNISTDDLKFVVNQVDEYTQNLDDYYKERYYKLFDSFVVFILGESTSFLGLQTPLPKDDVNMNQVFVTNVFNQLVNVLTENSADSPQLRIISKQPGMPGIKEQLEAALKLPAESGVRVYLLSAYKTISVGQNLQHDMSNDERKLAINVADIPVNKDDRRFSQIDLGGIFLGDVTHILTSVKNFKHLTTNTITMLAQLGALLENDEINQASYDAYLKQLENLSLGEDDDEDQYQPKQFKDCRSFVMSYTRTIVQAVGRLDRTHNKQKKLQIVLTADVLQNFNIATLNRQTLSPEALEIEAFQAKNIIAPIEQSEATHRNNQFQNLSYQTWLDFRRLSGRLQMDEFAIRYYRKARATYLQYPTISRSDLAALQNEDARCYQYLPIQDDHYSVHAVYREQASDVNRKKVETGIFEFGTANATSEISMEASGLPAILAYRGKRESMHEFFERCGYQTSWTKSDYIINPSQFSNYLGVLGEVAGKFILEDLFDIDLEDINDVTLYELFDFQTKYHVLFDFKNWRGALGIDATEARKKVIKKLDQFIASGSDWRVMTINVVTTSNYSQGNDVAYNISDQLMEVSALIDQQGKLVLTSGDKSRMEEFIFERGK